MSVFFPGLLFGLVLILAIGAQSPFVIDHGLQAGFPCVLIGVLTVCLRDILLIVLGAAGASAFLTTLDYRRSR
jgi:arginine exporter protein ArgO